MLCVPVSAFIRIAMKKVRVGTERARLETDLLSEM